MIAWLSAALAQTCDAPALPAPDEALSVAWVSPLRSRARADEWLVVVPTADLREYAQGAGSVGRTLQRLGLRKRPADPRRLYKVVVFDVARTSALGPVLKARAIQRLGDRLVDGVITVAASEHRSQLQNRRAAEERLTELLVEAVAPPPRKRRATRPSKGAVQRRLDEKKRRGQTKRLRRDLGE